MKKWFNTSRVFPLVWLVQIAASVLFTACADNSQWDVFDFNQKPFGYRGISPIGKLEDGTPVYGQVPSFAEVRGCFAVRDLASGRLYRFPSGRRGRDTVGKQMEDDLKKAVLLNDLAYQMNLQLYESRAQSLQTELDAMALRARETEMANQFHQQQLDDMERRSLYQTKNQHEHYKEGWRPLIEPGSGHIGTPDLMVDPKGDLYYVW